MYCRVQTALAIQVGMLYTAGIQVILTYFIFKYFVYMLIMDRAI